MKYPLAYIQGPPGTGKTNTIINTIITAFFNGWLKNNKELINVATSRARDKLIVLADSNNLKRLNQNDTEDDLYELVQYVRKNGESHVTQKKANSRALGVKPFSTATEEAFLENLTHALENIWLSQNKYAIQKEVAISQVFQDNISYNDLFYSGRFDFVVYEKIGKQQIPVLAIELDGKEHFSDEVVKNRDKKKNEKIRAAAVPFLLHFFSHFFIIGISMRTDFIYEGKRWELEN